MNFQTKKRAKSLQFVQFLDKHWKVVRNIVVYMNFLEFFFAKAHCRFLHAFFFQCFDFFWTIANELTLDCDSHWGGCCQWMINI